MKVKLQIEFEVENCHEEDGELMPYYAKGAASQAAYDYLAFVQVAGCSSNSEWVQVHVDGYGECKVRIGEDHE